MNYTQKLVDRKAEQDNTIDLNAYAMGIVDSKAQEMLDMLKRIMQTYDKGTQAYLDCQELIKKTEL